MTYAISPIMKNLDSLRIVLNWGQQPLDLDSHILYPNNHIYYMNKTGTDAWLDVDDTDSYGPETITIDRRHEGERYVYAVHDFSNGDNLNDTALSASSAKVFVYVGQTLVRTYYMPRNKVGNLWTVFAINENGDFETINTLSGVNSPERLQTAAFQNVIETTTIETITYSNNEQQSASELNRLGEQAYHANDYPAAINYYQQAINIYGNYGQAYSNLGLAFQKAGNTAEALWANRKAIALAQGATAATVRASSHYNNGKIYEEAGQFSDALREYHYAKREKQNEVYDKAILRMQKQGAR
jgi:tetratricopeptide (TPR) repeat protein